MCYNPMLARRLNFVNPETRKYQYKFVGKLINYLGAEQRSRTVSAFNLASGEYEYWDEEYVTESGESQLRRFGKVDLGLYGDSYVDQRTGEVITDAIVLPCGQCLECRCQYAQQWANRIMLEAQYHDESYMLTLTYDDEHVPRTWPYDESWDHALYVCDAKTGHVDYRKIKHYRGDEVYTLDPKDLQDFVKRLRRYQEYHCCNTIRYYGVGEYGTDKHRPHYHIIVFGLRLDDVVEVGANKHGTVLHDSATIRKIWGKGITEVSPLNWEDAAYVARYTTKKLGKAETNFYQENCLVPEFTRMSLKPAIGAQYYQDHKDEIYKYDEIHISTAKGGRTVKPPRYYDKLYDDVYPAGMAEVKGNRREVAERAMVARLDRWDGNYLELLEQRERAFKERTKSLQRHIE